MKIEEINEILSNLNYLDNKYNSVAQHQPDNYWSEKYESENSERTEIFNLNNKDNWHLKTTYQTDSYGDNERLVAIKFVKPVVKEITDFE